MVTLKEESLYRLRGQRHDVTTNKGVVSLLHEAINAFILDPDGSVIGRQELNTLGYVAGIQLRAIQAVQEEQGDGNSLSALLGAGGTVEIKMTKEERKMFLTAGTPQKMQRIVEAVHKDGRIVDLEQSGDGSYAARPIAEPPRSDAKMPIADIALAMQAEGVDITRAEVAGLLGPSLGEPHHKAIQVDVETFGFDKLMEVEPKSEPLLAHQWETKSFNHPQLPGVLVRVSQCTKCGTTTKNTRNHNNEQCGAV